MIAAVKRLHPLAPQLRVQAIHDDVTDDNVVALPDGRGGYLPFGVIDFGDIMRGWLVADIAVTCASLLHHADGDPFFVLPAIRAFHDTYPLNHRGIEGTLAADRRPCRDSGGQQRTATGDRARQCLCRRQYRS